MQNHGKSQRNLSPHPASFGGSCFLSPPVVSSLTVCFDSQDSRSQKSLLYGAVYDLQQFTDTFNLLCALVLSGPQQSPACPHMETKSINKVALGYHS